MKDIARKNLIDHIIQVLDNSKLIKYKLVDIDEDINFLITPIVKIPEIENTLSIHFILYCSDEHELTIYCPMLFRLEADGSIMYMLNAINNVNSKIAIGKIYLNSKNTTTISYINRVLFNDITNEFTTKLFEDYLSSFIFASIELQKEIKNRYEI
jgi:hypothetical protein